MGKEAKVLKAEYFGVFEACNSYICLILIVINIY